MLLVILLDWSDPWNWIQELRAWVRMLRSLLVSLPDETKMALEDNIHEWRDRKRRDANELSSSGGDAGISSIDADITLPLGPGEWDSPLGVPLCVVCQSANKIEMLEKESGWKDKHFDFMQQFVRTILLKHGGSLIYTMPHSAGNENGLQTLIHSSLGVQTMLQKKMLKHNTSDRDHILVPPNFDSWGKIRILTEDFNVEEVSQAWDQELEAESSDARIENGTGNKEEAPGSAVFMYHQVISNPRKDIDMPDLVPKGNSGIEVTSRETQSFLGEQAEILEELAKEDERTQLLRETKKNLGPLNAGEVEEHIGPVQFNMGGIQVDAEDMVKRLKVNS
jgi:dynein light intermediate chain 1